MPNNANSEILARILFLRMALKDIFTIFKICNLDMIYPHQLTRDFFFCKTLLLGSFVKIKPSRKFPNLQYAPSQLYSPVVSLLPGAGRDFHQNRGQQLPLFLYRRMIVYSAIPLHSVEIKLSISTKRVNIQQRCFIKMAGLAIFQS